MNRALAESASHNPKRRLLRRGHLLRLVHALGLGLDVQGASGWAGLAALDGIGADGDVSAEDSAFVNHQPRGAQIALVAR